MLERNVTFLRHGPTEPAPDEDDDKRHLGSAGIELAKSRRECLLYRYFDLAFCSPKIRTHETVSVIAGPEVPVVEVPELWFNCGDNVETMMQEAYKLLGDGGTLGQYMAHHPDLDHALLFGAGLAARKIQTAIEMAGSHSAVVIGHGVNLPAIGYVMAGAHKDRSAMLGVALSHCQGFRMRGRIRGGSHYWSDLELIR